MEKTVSDPIITIVHLLAKAATISGLSPLQLNALKQNVEALTRHDSDEFVRHFLGVVKDAHGVLTPETAAKLANYP